MLLKDVAETSVAVAATSGRREKVALLGECLRRAEPGDVPVVVKYLSGELRQRRTGLGYAALRDVPGPATAPTLSVAEVDAESLIAAVRSYRPGDNVELTVIRDGETVSVPVTLGSDASTT